MGEICFLNCWSEENCAFVPVWGNWRRFTVLMNNLAVILKRHDNTDDNMDNLEFYKEQYYKEIERKNDISNSLATPIGIISALVAGLFYSLTSFDFSSNAILVVAFILTLIVVLYFLSISIFHLIKAFSDFHNGFNYAYLIDTDDLDKYHKQLKEYYRQTNTTDISDAEFKDYVLSELIKSTGINQKNNKSKIKHRYLCHKYMINTFLTMCILTILFGINFGLQNTKQRIQKVEIDSTLNIKLQSEQNQIFTDSLIKKSIKMADEKEKKVEKPTPPPTQIIQEGKDPKIQPKPQTQTEKK